MRIVALAPDGRAALMIDDYIVGLEASVRFNLGAFAADTAPRDLLVQGDVRAAGRELHRALTALDDAGLQELEEDGFAQRRDTVKLLAPVRPRTLICAGNSPAGFLKLPSSVIGPDEDIVVPPDRAGSSVDCEGELCIVIGTPAHRVSEAKALTYVGGYTCGNDVSAWNDAGYATFNPLGPCIATRDEIPEFGDVQITTRVDGEVRRNESVSDLILSVAQMVSRWSHVYSLQPGDVISTGSPSGTGTSTEPSRLLQPGNRVEIEIPRIGVLSNRVVAH